MSFLRGATECKDCEGLRWRWDADDNFDAEGSGKASPANPAEARGRAAAIELWRVLSQAFPNPSDLAGDENDGDGNDLADNDVVFVVDRAVDDRNNGLAQALHVVAERVDVHNLILGLILPDTNQAFQQDDRQGDHVSVQAQAQQRLAALETETNEPEGEGTVPRLREQISDTMNPSNDDFLDRFDQKLS